jgi:hypothetical protein
LQVVAIAKRRQESPNKNQQTKKATTTEPTSQIAHTHSAAASIIAPQKPQISFLLSDGTPLPTGCFHLLAAAVLSEYCLKDHSY